MEGDEEMKRFGIRSYLGIVCATQNAIPVTHRARTLGMIFCSNSIEMSWWDLLPLGTDGCLVKAPELFSMGSKPQKLRHDDRINFILLAIKFILL